VVFVLTGTHLEYFLVTLRAGGSFFGGPGYSASTRLSRPFVPPGAIFCFLMFFFSLSSAFCPSRFDFSGPVFSSRLDTVFCVGCSPAACGPPPPGGVECAGTFSVPAPASPPLGCFTPDQLPLSSSLCVPRVPSPFRVTPNPFNFFSFLGPPSGGFSGTPLLRSFPSFFFSLEFFFF